VLVREWGFFIAMLRFDRNATIHEHPGANDTVVMCIDGEGWTSVADARTQIRAGELVHWPKEVPHRLWTESTQMTTLMFERVSV
jgi:quercetin dioxygenase-like cupin family protein